jgi:hypothetical protein
MSKVLLVVGLLAVAGAVYYVQSLESPPATAAAAAGPPAGAEYFPEPPEVLIGPASTAHVAARRGQPSPVADVIGLWVPESGWEGEVTEIAPDHIRLRRYSTAVVGGELSIVAQMPRPEGVEKGKIVRVQGRISDVRVKAAVAQVFNVVHLEQARLVP